MRWKMCCKTATMLSVQSTVKYFCNAIMHENSFLYSTTHSNIQNFCAEFWPVLSSVNGLSCKENVPPKQLGPLKSFPNFKGLKRWWYALNNTIATGPISRANNWCYISFLNLIRSFWLWIWRLCKNKKKSIESLLKYFLQFSNVKSKCHININKSRKYPSSNPVVQIINRNVKVDREKSKTGTKISLAKKLFLTKMGAIQVKTSNLT